MLFVHLVAVGNKLTSLDSPLCLFCDYSTERFGCGLQRVKQVRLLVQPWQSVKHTIGSKWLIEYNDSELIIYMVSFP